MHLKFIIKRGREREKEVRERRYTQHFDKLYGINESINQSLLATIFCQGVRSLIKCCIFLCLFIYALVKKCFSYRDHCVPQKQ